MDEEIEKLRPLFEKLLAFRDGEDQGLTQQGMADKLNSEGLLSLTGQPWSKYSIRRILKKLDLQTEASVNQAKNQPRKRPVSRSLAAAAGAEHILSDSSPLRQWSYYESLRGVIDELTQSPCSEKALAEKLNERKIATVDGRPWDKSSVARVLKTLSPNSATIKMDDDDIRSRIRQGFYDTDTERFVAVPVDKKKGKSKDKPAKKAKGKKKKDKKNKGRK